MNGGESRARNNTKIHEEAKIHKEAKIHEGTTIHNAKRQFSLSQNADSDRRSSSEDPRADLFP